MNIRAKTAEKGVPLSPNVLGFRHGNILHTGGVVGSTPTAPTTPFSHSGSVEEVPSGSYEPVAQGTSSMPRPGSAYPELSGPDRNRFSRKIERRTPEECWPWLGAHHPKGYGRFKVGGRLYSSHRLAYELANGPIPPERVRTGLILHGCHNPACCNPQHLRLGTNVENVRDAVAAGRWTQGFRNKGTGHLFGKNVGRSSPTVSSDGGGTRG